MLWSCMVITCLHSTEFVYSFYMFEHEQQHIYDLVYVKWEHVCGCLPFHVFLFVVHRIVCICNHISMCHVHVCSICVCFLHVILMEVMVSLCLSGVNPRHLAVIGSFLLYWNSKWFNHTSYGKQSIFGSDIHSTSKPQIAPIKGPVWHAHTNTQLFDLIWLVSISGRWVFPFQIGLNLHLSALVHQGSQLCVCVNTSNVFVRLWYMCTCPHCFCVLTIMGPA